MKNLQGKTALLTGASRGIGPYIGRALAEHGVNVVLTARGADALEANARELESMGVRATPIAADIAERTARERLLEQTRAAIGPIDILINNAGMEWLSRYTSLSTDYIETMIRTNLIASGPLPARVTSDARAAHWSHRHDVISRGEEGITILGHLWGDEGCAERVDSRYSRGVAGDRRERVGDLSRLRLGCRNVRGLR